MIEALKGQLITHETSPPEGAINYAAVRVCPRAAEASSPRPPTRHGPAPPSTLASDEKMATRGLLGVYLKALQAAAHRSTRWELARGVALPVARALSSTQ